jgi:uncharacterized membrane protein (DUF373 family)
MPSHRPFLFESIAKGKRQRAQGRRNKNFPSFIVSYSSWCIICGLASVRKRVIPIGKSLEKVLAFWMVISFQRLSPLKPMRLLKKFVYLFRDSCQDKSFLNGIDQLEGFVSKILSVVMAVVILVAVVDLIILLFHELFLTPGDFLNKTLFQIFGLFLNILIALELLDNIAAYLRDHSIQVELVIVTSLIAVARKIIILDLEKITGTEIIGLAIAILALSISYWIIRNLNPKKPNE